MARKSDKKVKDLAAKYTGKNVNFAHILNRLWLTGKDPNELQKALASSKGGTNDMTDIVARLLNSGLATEEEITKAATVPLPNDVQWAFASDNVQGGVIKPKHTLPYFTPGSLEAGVGVPNAAIKLTAPTPAQQQQFVLPSPGKTTKPGQPPVRHITTPAGNERPKPNLSTPEGIDQYQKEHFGSMLWVEQVPELNQIIQDAARGEWSPERFKAEIESTPWWTNTSDSIRKYTALKTDTATFGQRLNDKAAIIRANAATYGITLSDDDVNRLADESLKFEWDDNFIKKQVVNSAKYDPNQSGALGQQIGAVKGTARNFVMKLSDNDAFNYARQIASGDIAPETFEGLMRTQAKAAYPGLAAMIDQGVAPRIAMANHINTAAELLDMDPEEIDLTDDRWNPIVNHIDEKGQPRTMTQYETSKFIKQKDEYWKSSHANKEVSTMLSGIGRMFGRSAV